MDLDFQTRYVTAGSLLYSVEHRPWLPPDGHWLLSQSWNDLLFAHYAMEPSVVRALVPEALTLELYDGVAWVTLVPFSTSHMRPSGVPPIPGLSYFSQINLRTYVIRDGKPGLYYFSVDTANLSTVWFARVFFRMQYWHATIQVKGATIDAPNAAEKTIEVSARRLHGPLAAGSPPELAMSYRPVGEGQRARAGSLDHFLTERYCVYSWNRGKLYRTEVHHQPWLLQPAEVEVRRNTLGEAAGIALSAQPDRCHFSRTLKMLVWGPERAG